MSEQDKIAAGRASPSVAPADSESGSAVGPVPAAPVSGLIERLRLYKANERHENIAETMYWFRQYKILAEEAAQALRESEEENKRWLAKAMLYAPQLESAESRLALARELLGEWLPICDEVLNNYWRKDAKDEDACMGWDDAKLTIGMLRRIRAFLKDQP